MKKLVSIAFVLIGIVSYSQSNLSCVDMDQICPDNSYVFPVVGGGNNAMLTEPGNQYNCLGTAPNPYWYYLEVTASGDIVMSLSASHDIDFIIYGPFPNLVDAQSACGNLGDGGSDGSVIDCSYSSTNMETPMIPSANAGEFYVMLITNFFNSDQEFTLSQTGGTGVVNCDSVQVNSTPAYICNSTPGTYSTWVDPAGPIPSVLNSGEISLCQGDAYTVNSNDDYSLPFDTILQPIGDGIYSAQLMWLVYSAPPSTSNPALDPGFLFVIIPGEDFTDVNDGSSAIVNFFGCGTYYFVPVAGDDGVGGNNNVANGTNDNGSMHWDKDNNGCYLFGAPLKVTYACAPQPTTSVNCNAPVVNGIDITLGTGSGSYTIMNTGSGDLSNTILTSPGTETVSNLLNGETWSLTLIDQQGCSSNLSGVFAAPVITNVSITPGADCPSAVNGAVDVTVSGTSGQGAPYSIVMDGGSPVAGTTASYSGAAGTLVPIIVTDAAGCIADSAVTIPSLGHFINVQTNTVTSESCVGSSDGSANIQATPIPSGSVTSIVWTDPLGSTFPGTATNTSQSNMMAGDWTVCVTDNIGCEVCQIVEITSPNQLQIFLENLAQPFCYGYNDGSIDIGASGGTSPYAFSWSHNSSLTNDVANLLSVGSYIGYVEDVNGCTDSVEVILQQDSLYADISIQNVLCYGDYTGAISVDNVYGSYGYVYYWWDFGGVIPDPSSTVHAVNDLPAGQFFLSLLDQHGCSKSYQLIVDQNPALVFTSLGADPVDLGMDGAVYAVASGGVPGYSYIWTNLDNGNFTANSSWGGLDVGAYEIIVVDDIGCKLIDTVYIGYLGLEKTEMVDKVWIGSNLVTNNELIVGNKTDGPISFSIYDLNGKLIATETIFIGSTKVNIVLSDGMYLYQLSDEDGPLKAGKIVVGQ